jgi:ABC-type branched-subunit amino acid transport system substrate-binding protein
MRRNWCTAAAAAIAVLTVAGCSQPAVTSNDPLQRKPGQVYLYGTDGNMLNAVGDLLVEEHPNALVGMKGTTPLTPLSQSFRDRLLAVDSGLQDFTYAGETYDAVVISALAAQVAKSSDSKAIAAQINGVTVGGEPCNSPATCMPLVKAGRDIAYRGITLGFGGFTDAGEPSATSYGILRFAAENQIDASQTQYVPTGNAGKATKNAPPAPAAGGVTRPLAIGALLPHTGDLASAGPPMFAGGILAVQEINATGGVLDQPVRWVDGDDFTDGDKAIGTAERLIEQEQVQVIIGAGASSISLAVLPTILAAGVILFSPCNTAAELSTTDDKGLYFRTAPPDDLQAAAVTDIIMRDGVRKVAIIAREDAYGRGLLDSVHANLVAAGIPEDALVDHAYNPDTPDFPAIAAAIKAFDPDGILIISFDETAKVVDALLKEGITSIAN